MSCIDCEGSGRVWYRIGHSGVVGLMPCECKQEPDSYLDTRHEDLAEQARRKWLNLRTQINFLMWQHRHNRSPKSRAEINKLLDLANVWWGAYLQLSQKAVA